MFQLNVRKSYTKILLTIASFVALLSVRTVHGFEARIGFASGSEFTSVRLDGSLHVYCMGNGTELPRSAYYTCRAVTLEPNGFDFFQGPPTPGAKWVRLTATHEDGTKKVKEIAFNSESGRSRFQFNLWTRTLLQEPLLDMGLNKIHWELRSFFGKGIKEGDFTVTTAKGTNRTCPDENYSSIDSNDCVNQFAACEKYFRSYNYCK